MKENGPIRGRYHFLVALNVICVTLLIISHVVQNRVIALGPTYATATIFVYPITCMILDIVSEVYGYAEARKALWLSIIATFIFAIPVWVFTKLPVPSFWTSYDHDFGVAMGQILRVTIMSSIAIIVGQSINIYVISKLRIRLKGRFFALRSMCSSMIGDTSTVIIALTSFFIGRMPINEIITITVTELIIMYLFALVLAFPGNLIVFLLKRIEPQNEDRTIKFNPFL